MHIHDDGCVQLMDTICMLVAEEMDASGQNVAEWAFYLHIAFAPAAFVAPLIIATNPPKVHGVKLPWKVKIVSILSQFRCFYVITSFWLCWAQTPLLQSRRIVHMSALFILVFCSELITLTYYIWVGYRFRPTASLKQFTTMGPMVIRFNFPGMFRSTQHTRRYAPVDSKEDNKQEEEEERAE
jgi:hypothetical protein